MGNRWKYPQKLNLYAHKAINIVFGSHDRSPGLYNAALDPVKLESRLPPWNEASSPAQPRSEPILLRFPSLAPSIICFIRDVVATESACSLRQPQLRFSLGTGASRAIQGLTLQDRVPAALLLAVDPAQSVVF